jgi:hypothetical protein
MRLSTDDAERLLIVHWDHLRFIPYFVQTALYIGTPLLLRAAQQAISDCPRPSRLLEYLSIRYGIRMKGHAGLTREAQLRALVPYLDLLSVGEISQLWHACNDRGWFNSRREFLDCRLRPQHLESLWDRDRAVAKLDAMISRHPPYWIDHWIDEFLKTDTPWSEILSVLAEWTGARQSLRAFNRLAEAIVHCGNRNDLAVLSHQKIAAEYPGNELLVDTAFAVRRRTIH